MSGLSTKSMPRFRPRISLLSALLLMTIVGMGIVIVQLWREIGPLRAEVREKRQVLGQLWIDDPQKAHVIQVATEERNKWKWRIYLPPGVQYDMHCRSGILPPRWGTPDWLAAMKYPGSPARVLVSGLTGEFTLEAKIIQLDEQWTLVTTYYKDESGLVMKPFHQLAGDWRSDGYVNIGYREVGQQTTFAADRTILLLHVHKPTITEFVDGYAEQTKPHPDDGVVLWMQPRGP